MPNASPSLRLRALPSVATLVAERAPVALGGVAAPGKLTEGPHFADVQQLIAAGFTPDAVLLAPGDARQAATWLESLRRDVRLGLAPILLNRSFGDAIDALSDGVASTSESAAQHAAAITARATSLGRRELPEGDERLLAFLYLRTGRVLTPVADWRDQRIYRYPLADALGRPGEDGFLMLDRLRRRGLLETASLIERVHTCPACSAGQLLFIETCPQCGSIDTVSRTSCIATPAATSVPRKSTSRKAGSAARNAPPGCATSVSITIALRDPDAVTTERQ